MVENILDEIARNAEAYAGWLALSET